MPTLKIYTVTMKDGSEIVVRAYTHSHALEVAERQAKRVGWTGKGLQAVKAELMTQPPW